MAEQAARRTTEDAQETANFVFENGELINSTVMGT